MKQNLVEVVFIMDRSGSMYPLQQDSIGGFNAMLSKQQQEEGTAYVTTFLFNQRSEILHDRIDIKDVKPLTLNDYQVGGCTALYDCLGEAIKHIDMVHKYIKDDDKPEKVIFIITTDGYENASHKYRQKQIKKMIQDKTKKGWEFIYLAANIDAASTADEIGIEESRTCNYHHDAFGVENVYASVSEAIVQCRRSKKLSESWCDQVRQDYNSRKGTK